MSKFIYVPREDQAPFGSQVVTLDDLERSRVTLMMDIKKVLDGQLARSPKRWVKSHEVQELLKIS